MNLRNLNVGSAYEFRSNANDNFNDIATGLTTIDTNICNNASGGTIEWNASSEGSTMAKKLQKTGKLHTGNMAQLEAEVSGDTLRSGEFALVLDDVIE